MILGLSTSNFTVGHVALSVAGIVSGLFVVVGMLGSKRWPGWTALFFLTTMLTSVTGFFFPRDQVLPTHILGLMSLVALAVAFWARYVSRLAGASRWIYVLAAVLALYLNAFAAVVQLFQKLPFLQPLAPTQSEPPFVYTQLAMLAIFVLLGIIAMIRFRPPAPQQATLSDIRRAGA